jgi:hypothetical protein
MFIYFSKNKLNYNKGQLTPVYIVILTLLIIMAMVTVNLSKVAFIKTESSNAADAGALAAGSVMANVFNSVAQLNSQMELAYWQFYASMSVSFMIALALLTIAYLKADSALALAGIAAEQIAEQTICVADIPAGMAGAAALAASGYLASLKVATIAIGLTITAFSIAQYFFYLVIREMAQKGRDSAIKIGHGFVFSNSGIGSKLKEGEPRNAFSAFLDSLNSSEYYKFLWQDGQGRGHSVDSKVHIDEVDTFDLRITILPSLVVSALLTTSGWFASSGAYEMIGAAAAYKGVVPVLKLACKKQACCFAGGPAAAACCPAYVDLSVGAGIVLGIGIKNNTVAIASTTPIFPLLLAAWEGLLPGLNFTSSSAADTLPFIISWIDDIDHNRLVRVDTNQHHEGTDLGLWQTQYPETYSYSVVDFRGMGQIYPAVLRHDASIIDTDRMR